MVKKRSQGDVNNISNIYMNLYKTVVSYDFVVYLCSILDNLHENLFLYLNYKGSK